jgi:hypothetical protein
MGVADRKCEEAERDCNHQSIHHGSLPLRSIAMLILLACGVERGHFQFISGTTIANASRILPIALVATRRIDFPDGHGGNVIGDS